MAQNLQVQPAREELTANLVAGCTPSFKQKFTEAWSKTGRYVSESEVLRDLVSKFIERNSESQAKSCPT